MIRVKMELLPGGMDLGDDNEFLGEIYIANNVEESLKTEGQRGTYDAIIRKKRKTVEKIRISDFPRKAYHPWELVRLILNAAVENNRGRPI